MTPSESQNTDHDAQLMRRVTSGDQDAFAALFDRHASVVLGVLIRILRRREEAEEILQDVFHQAWEDAHRYRSGRATPRGWLIMLARSRAIDRLRSNQARGRREQTVQDERTDLEVQPVGTASLEANERRTRVLSALEQLSEEQRQCVELAFYQGLTHSQIAARLEAPLGTVKSRILLGMKKLRATLDSGSYLSSPQTVLGSPAEQPTSEHRPSLDR